MNSKLKTVLTWVQSHFTVILGSVVVVFVLAGCWTGSLGIPEGAALAAVGLGMMGFHLTSDALAKALHAVAASGVDYRTGNRTSAVGELAALAPLTLTIAGERQEVLAAATQLKASQVVAARPLSRDELQVIAKAVRNHLQKEASQANG